MSFSDWDDPSVQPSDGPVRCWHNASDIEITTGLVAGIFDDVVQFTYGWNLTVEKKRTYFGVGFSFVNVIDRLGKLIPKK